MKIRNKLLALIITNVFSFGAEYYVKSDDNLIYNTPISNHEIKSILGVEWGGAFKDKEIFTFLGGKLKSGTMSHLDGSGNIGFNFKKKLSKSTGIILNLGYLYNDGYEDNIKEIVKLRGEWNSKFEKDKETLKEYYHSQGLRFKDKQSLFLSSIVNYDNNKLKGYSGLIYSSEGFHIESLRFENFIKLETKNLNHNVGVDLNYKLKKHNDENHNTYKKGGRLKGNINVKGKIGIVETYNGIKFYAGTILPSKKDYNILSNNELNVRNGNIRYKAGINGEITLKEVESFKNLKYIYKPEIMFGIKYDKDRLLLENINKLKGRIFIDKSGLYKDGYDKSKNIDTSIGSIYSDNKLIYRFNNFDIRGISKYRISSHMNKDKYEGLEHLLSTGIGFDYNKNYENTEIKHSSDLRYLFGYADKKTFSIINFWSDNKLEHKINDKLNFGVELNLTSSNRFRVLNRDAKEDELLLLVDGNGILKYNINPRFIFKNKLEFKNIILFSNFSNINNVKPKAQEQAKNNEQSSNKFLLDSQYILNIYNESELTYKIKNNIDIKGKFFIGYNQLKSNKLYDSLKNLKREQIDENGIREFSSKDIKIINEEKKIADDYYNFLITTGIESEMRYINDKLIIKPSLEFGTSHMFSINFENDDKTNIFNNKIHNVSFIIKKIFTKIGLNLEYRW
ncbi:hypothetical protein [Streptobacillus moniliformis]|uniref:hypothetical protein n=1 Tax=Streptobacillus moniliformis TaxID=34105 RepID=UPI0007E3BC1E|nr:hypothetical protein [Streptobacillus moniliformis]